MSRNQQPHKLRTEASGCCIPGSSRARSDNLDTLGEAERFGMPQHARQTQDASPSGFWTMSNARDAFVDPWYSVSSLCDPAAFPGLGMHPSDVTNQERARTGQCKGENGYVRAHDIDTL